MVAIPDNQFFGLIAQTGAIIVIHMIKMSIAPSQCLFSDMCVLFIEWSKYTRATHQFILLFLETNLHRDNN